MYAKKLLWSGLWLGLMSCGVSTENYDLTELKALGPAKKDAQQSGSISVSEDVQSSDAIVIDDPAVVETSEPEPVAEPPAVVVNPPSTVQAFDSYRISISEMKVDCSGNTVGIERLMLKAGGVYLDDTFKNYPDSNDPIYNDGSIGGMEASVATSGNFNDFYPFEVFGGGFGAGWFSDRDSFADNVSPSPALKDTFVQLNFKANKVQLEAVFINGGSENMAGFEACSPSKLKISASKDGGATWVELADFAGDTEAGVEIPLVYPAAVTSL